MDHDKLRAAFDGADTNSDGSVSINEAIAYANTDPHAYQALVHALQRGDSDRDQRLSFDEFVAHFEAARG